MTAVEALFARACLAWRPPARMPLSQWADTYFYLSAESAAEPGKWLSLPYQRGILDAFTDPDIERVTLMKSARVGWALALDTPLPTPDGWTTMGDVSLGARLFDEQGRPCRVTFKSQVYTDHACYRVRFCDGSEVVADAGHLWLVESDVSLEHLTEQRRGRTGRPGPGRTASFSGVIDTNTMARAMRTSRGRTALAIANAGPLQVPEAPALAVPPYTFGLWLGDGHSVTPRVTLHRSDVEVADYVAEEGITPSVRYIDARHPDNATIFFDVPPTGKPVSPWCGKFRKIGVLGSGQKHIPQDYLRSGINQRLALLRGLMDSDGTIGADGRAEFVNTSERLASGVYELVVSLGMKASIRRRAPQTPRDLPQWRVNFKAIPEANPFRLKRKAARVLPPVKPSITYRRRVVSVEPIPSVPVQCVEVDSPSHLFLAGRQMVPTHNTKCLNAVIGYYMHQDPCPLMLVQPTIEDAEGYSKEEIAPMLRDVPVLAAIMPPGKSKDSDNTILAKRFPGGSLSMVGANSPRGFRRVSRKVVLFDETDGYPPSAGAEGDQIQLGIRRTEYYWDRKIGDGSTPTIAGRSRIESAFYYGDQRRYYVPCPHCDFRQVLQFKQLRWPKGQPEAAVYVCLGCGAEIEHRHKHAMVRAGEWRPGPHPQFPDDPPPGPFRGHASFHIWAAYSFSPNASWGQICKEFVDAERNGPDVLKTFVNTVLGEPWRERGDAPEWQRLYDRRERYEIGTCPAGVVFLTAGVDVQKDRLVYEVVGWGREKRSWSIDAGVLHGETSDLGKGPWGALDTLLGRSFEHAGGAMVPISMLAVDSGFNTNTVYNWARTHPMSRVIAVKGVSGGHVLVGVPSRIDVTVSGKKLKRGYKVWPVASHVAKGELYGWLAAATLTDDDRAGGQAEPSGFCHFPQYGEEYFSQLTAEQLVTTKTKRGVVFSWEMIPGRENHYLDARVYARAAAAVVGIDRFREQDWAALEKAIGVTAPPKVGPPAAVSTAPEPPPPANPPAPRRAQGWLQGRSNGWLGRKRR